MAQEPAPLPGAAEAGTDEQLRQEGVGSRELEVIPEGRHGVTDQRPAGFLLGDHDAATVT